MFITSKLITAIISKSLASVAPGRIEVSNRLIAPSFLTVVI